MVIFTLMVEFQSIRRNIYSGYLRLGLISLAMFSLALRSEGATKLELHDVISGIDNAQQNRERKLAGYTAREHYTVRNSHFKQSAELIADVVYQKRLGKKYQVLWRAGPSFLQRRVTARFPHS